MLQRYFDSYFWTFRLVVLAAVAFLLAQIMTVVFGTVLRPSAAALAASRAVSAESERAFGSKEDRWVAFLSRNVFKARRDSLPSGPATGGAGGSLDCRPSPVAVRLVTTLVADDPKRSVAAFRAQPGGYVVVAQTGDRLLEQAAVVAIERGAVRVQRDGRCEYFMLDREAAATSGAPTQPAKTGLGQGIKAAGPRRYVVPRTERDRILSELGRVAAEVRIVPAFREGRSIGFKVFRVRSGSLFARLGLRNGDVVRAIDGHEMTSPQRALAIYAKLQDASDFVVDVERRGKKLSIRYSIE